MPFVQSLHISTNCRLPLSKLCSFRTIIPHRKPLRSTAAEQPHRCREQAEGTTTQRLDHEKASEMFASVDKKGLSTSHTMLHLTASPLHRWYVVRACMLLANYSYMKLTPTLHELTLPCMSSCFWPTRRALHDWENFSNVCYIPDCCATLECSVSLQPAACSFLAPRSACPNAVLVLRQSKSTQVEGKDLCVT